MAVSFVAASAFVQGTTSVAPTWPAGAATGDRALIVVCDKPDTSTPATPAGWTLPTGGSVVVGTGTQGVGTGLVRLTIFEQVVGATPPASGTAVTVSIPSGNAATAGICLYRKASTATWAALALSSGSDTTSATTFSATGGAMSGWSSGDMLLALLGVTANTSVASEALTLTGVTLGATARQFGSATATGNALRMNVAGAPVTSAGPTTGTPTATATFGAASTGGALFVDLSEVAGAQALAQAPVDSLGLADSHSRSVGRATDDQHGLTDSVVASLGRSTQQSDALGLVDSVTAALSRGQAAQDDLGLADQVSLATARSQALSDPLGLSDSVSLDAARLAQDALGLADPASASVGKAPSDALGLTDAVVVTRQLGLSVEDPLGTTDVATTDLARVTAVSATDPLGLTDAPTLSVARVTQDQMGLADSASSAVGRALGEQLGLGDLLALAAGRASVDPVGLTDSIATDLFRATEHSPADQLGLSDAVSLVLSRDLARVDPLGLTDSVVLSAAQARPLADDVGLADSVSLAVERVVLDQVPLRDEVALAVDRLLLDAIGLSDSVDLGVVGPLGKEGRQRLSAALLGSQAPSATSVRQQAGHGPQGGSQVRAQATARQMVGAS